MSDTSTSGGAGGSPAPASVPASPPSAPVSSGASSSTGGTANANTTPSVPSGAGSAAAAASFRDQLATHGIDLRTQFQDDGQAIQYLVGQMRQQAQHAQQMSQYENWYRQNAEQFGRYQAWQQEQIRAQQSQQQQAQQWWKAPEYDPSWQHKITRDPNTGEVRAMPGAPPDTVQKYLAWAEHKTKFIDQFSQDPIKAIQPGIEQIAEQVAQRMVQQHLGQYQTRTLANQLVEQNSSWMHETDPRTGLRTLSEHGRRYAAYVQQADQSGLRDVNAQHEYAVGLVERDYLRSQYAQQQQNAQAQAQAAPQQPAVDPAQAVKNTFLQQAAGQQRTNPPPAPPPGNTQGSKPVGFGPRALASAMANNLQANGFLPGQALAG